MEIIKNNKEVISLAFQIIMWMAGIIISYIIGRNSKNKEEKSKKKSTLFAIRQEIVNNHSIIYLSLSYLKENNAEIIDSNQVDIKLDSNIWSNCLSNISYLKNEELLNTLSEYYRFVAMTQTKARTIMPGSFFSEILKKSEKCIEAINKEL